MKKSELKKMIREEIAIIKNGIPAEPGRQNNVSPNTKHGVKIKEIEGSDELPVETRSKIILFIKNNPNLDDTKFHDFVESLGVDPHEAEEVVYNELHKRLTMENKK